MSRTNRFEFGRTDNPLIEYHFVIVIDFLLNDTIFCDLKKCQSRSTLRIMQLFTVYQTRITQLRNNTHMTQKRRARVKRVRPGMSISQRFHFNKHCPNVCPILVRKLTFMVFSKCSITKIIILQNYLLASVFKFRYFFTNIPSPKM